MWNSDFVSLAEFISRLKQLQATADPNSRVHISAGETTFSALAYVIDEVRKAQLKHVTVESATTPDPKLGFSWF